MFLYQIHVESLKVPLIRMTQGWYTKIITKQNQNTRWLTINDFWINIYSNKKDLIPLFCLHTSKLEITEDSEEYSNMYSFDITINHPCAHHSLKIATPNQFDILEIRQKLQSEIERWIQYLPSAEIELPKRFVMDYFGKFIYRSCDRLHVTITDDGIEVKQEDKEDISIKFDSSFDAHPTLETDEDCKWIAIASDNGSHRFHCQTLEDTKDFVIISLIAANRSSKTESV